MLSNLDRSLFVCVCFEEDGDEDDNFDCNRISSVREFGLISFLVYCAIRLGIPSSITS